MNNNLLHNLPFVSAFLGMLIAQGLKPLVSLIFYKKFDLHLLFSTGSMPSSHSAAVVALATSIGIVWGIGSTAFAISMVLAGIVIHDAMGIRNEAGKQAQVINNWSRVLSSIAEEGKISEENLKTMLGHSFSQVAGGILLGIIVGFLFTKTILF